MSFSGPLLGGRYRLGPALGHGSQAETFLARDERADKGLPAEVVVKRITPRGAWKSFELFEREAKVLGQLRHAGIPRLHASFEEPPGTFNLVLQRMPGDDLRALVKRRRLAEVELRDVLIRALEILDYLHTRAPVVVHRDLKPSNLVRAPDGKLAIVDFGGVLDAARASGGSTIVGTFGYMAPEQLHGQVTPATDLYALGATIVALAGGVEPEDVPRRGLRMDLDRHLPQLEPALRAALTAMTDPDPDRRPQRARDVIAILATAPRAATPAAALPALRAYQAAGPPARRADRLFADIPEPAGALLRLACFAFGGAGWLAMLALRLPVLIVATMVSVLAFPARAQVRRVAADVTATLKEGQDGFGDIARRSLSRAEPPALPPGSP